VAQKATRCKIIRIRGNTCSKQTWKSEGKEVQPQELKFEDDRMDAHAAIKGIVDAVKDVKEDVRGQRNQLAHLLYTQIDPQRSENSTKLLLNNFWKYSEATSQTLLQSHR
jgi:hypothetical protein